MKTLIVLLLGCLAFAVAKVEVRVIDAENSIESQYVVVFQKSATQKLISEHMNALSKGFAADTQFDNEILSNFAIGQFRGYSARLSPRMLENLQQNSALISYIEQDASIYAFQSCSLQTDATWGIDRIAEKVVNLDGNYNYGTTAGEGVDAYIVDTGINVNHIDFGTRALWGANFVDSVDTDCNGHGTHVAGTIGGSVYGVSKKSTLIAVKVLDCGGSGSYAGVVDGVNWVVNSTQTRKKPSVANMSLGGPISIALDDAVNAAVEEGIVFVVAAGNSNDDACYYSPADAKLAISVGATGIDSNGPNQVDTRAYFSNYGECVDIFAPGLMITSDWIGANNNEILTISGTSMASPHIAGVSVLYLGTNPDATPADVEAFLLEHASDNLIVLECSGAYYPASCNESPNVFVYSPC